MRKFFIAGVSAVAITLGGCISTSAIDTVIADVHAACGIILTAGVAQGLLNAIGLGSVATIIADVCGVVSPAKFAASMRRAQATGVPDYQCYGVVDGVQICGYAATKPQVRAFMHKHGMSP